MMARTSRIYRVEANDTLDSIAASFELSSWRAVAQAPENRSMLAMAAADTPLTEGDVIRVPPAARALLVERVYALHRLRPMLQVHFQVLESLFSEDVMPLEIIGELSDERIVTSVLSVLAAQVKKDVELAHQAARPIADINTALALTHLHDQGDLKDFANRDSGYTGLNWVLTPLLLEPWYNMWSSAFWASRWRTTKPEKAKQALAIHLNMIRSIVMQQTNRRIDESYRSIWSLDREPSENP